MKTTYQMYKHILIFLEITYHKKENKCIHNRPVSQSTKLFKVFFYPKYLDLYSLSKIFPKNDSFPALEGLLSSKITNGQSPSWGCKRNKAGPAALRPPPSPLAWYNHASAIIASYLLLMLSLQKNTCFKFNSFDI